MSHSPCRQVSGVQRLGGTLSIKRFQKVFPDQGGWCRRFLGRGKAMTLASLFDVVRYDGPPELFSMYACLFADVALLKVAPQWVEDHVGDLQVEARRYHACHGLHPHPAVLLSLAHSAVGS